MALVKCPECVKEISSQLRKCNNCGYKLKIFDKNKSNRFIFIGGVLIILIIIIAIIGININKRNQEKFDKEYHDQLVAVGSKIYVNGLLSSLYCYDIGQVWYNTIFKKHSSQYDKYTRITTKGYSYGEFNSDFNTSINKYLTINKDKINELKEQQKEIKEEVLKLQNKPNQKYKESYNKMIELYGAFNNLIGQAISPSGTYKDYISNYNQYSTELNAAYEQLVVLIPEIENYNEESK